MMWYWYWLRVDKETRQMFPGCRLQFCTREEAIEHGKTEFGNKAIEIEEEQEDTHRTLKTIYVSPAAELIENGGQLKMFRSV